MNTTWNEIKKFISNNFKNIIIGSLILGTLLSAIIYLTNNNDDESVDEQTTISESADSQLNLDQKPFSYFQYYVELQDGRAFTNDSIAREYFSQDDLMLNMAREVGVPYENVFFNEGIEEGTSTVSQEDMGENYFINIERDNTSNLVTFIVNSDKPQKNLDIANYYFSLIDNEEVPFYQNKYLFSLTEPKLNQIQPEKEEIEKTEEARESKSNISITSILSGYILSTIIVTGFYVIKSLFSKKLIYSFSYVWNIEDDFYLIDSNSYDAQGLNWFLNTPQNNKVFLNEQKDNNHLKSIFDIDINNNNYKENISYYQDIINFDNDNEIDEIILVINENETSRNWYNKQRKLISMQNNINIKIIQINK